MAAADTYVGTCVFRGEEYLVTISESEESLEVEVEDRMTSDQWRARFDLAYIEDLTHKTGNYKQFSIFVSMLESALTQKSDSVSLDLLTYTDLESLRNRKSGNASKSVPASRSTSLSSKRYLILTYTVEFDRIHYPLPLPYVGKPDPHVLQETVRQLREELKMLKNQGKKGGRSAEYSRRNKEFELLLQEKEDIETEFLEFKRQMHSSAKGALAKEVNILKGIVKSQEEELISEKAKYQRAVAKKTQERKQLMEELDDIKASERNLRVRVKSLTNELAVYRRQRRPSFGTRDTSSASNRRENSKTSYTRDRSVRSAPSSRENSFSRNLSHLSRLSRDRSPSPLYNKNRSANNSYESSNSRTLRARSRERSLSRDRNLNRSGGSFRSRTPSPVGSNRPRFDPTSYVKNKERQKQETLLKKRREAHRGPNNSMEKRIRPSSASSDRSFELRKRTVSRSSSVGSLRSRTSSVESLSDVGMASDSSQGNYRKRRVLNPSQRNVNAWASAGTNGSKKYSNVNSKILSSTPERHRGKPRTRPRSDKENQAINDKDVDCFDRSAEISEIDARLSRLQKFIKTNIQ